MTYEHGNTWHAFSDDLGVAQNSRQSSDLRVQTEESTLWYGTSHLDHARDGEKFVVRDFELLRLEKKLHRNHLDRRECPGSEQTFS